MAPAAIATPNLLVGPGYLFWAPVTAALPTHASTASAFSDTWPVEWLPLGATVEGSTFSYESTVEAMNVAEFFDPIKYSTTGRTGSFAFALAEWSLTNMKRALNGGTITTSGSGATAVNSYTPPTPGSEVRCKVGWESQTNDVRVIIYQALASGTIESAFQKAPDFSRIPITFNMEVPSGSSAPFGLFTAGTGRA
jgi:hypothetical protein